MNVWPLIVRELRAEARRPNTYWVRAFTAGTLTAIFVWATWTYQAIGGNLGPVLFNALAVGLVFSALAIVAAITGDSISREKREGTLGLLFLTPLRARDIVVGKTLLHALRSVPIFLGTAPIVLLPFLLGGIAAMQVVVLLIGLAVALTLAVASGVLASVYSREWAQSIVLAMLICAGLSAICVAGIFMLVVFLRSIWIGVVASVLFAAVALFFALRHAGRQLEGKWQQEESRGESWWTLLFSKSDFWNKVFKWDTRKARDRNPIAWLQEYNWGSRLTKWGWCILLFAAQWQMLLQFRQYIDYQMQLYRLTALGIAFSAAASFRRERQTGALELLLVTPISAGRLLWGRLQGVWFHFFPAMAILACVWLMGPQWISLPYRFSFYLLGAYFCIPVIGFYCALLSSNVLISWLLTIFFALVAPYMITEAFRFDIGRRNLPAAFFIIELVFAILAGILLYENLKSRRFALRRA